MEASAQGRVAVVAPLTTGIRMVLASAASAAAQGGLSTSIRLAGGAASLATSTAFLPSNGYVANRFVTTYAFVPGATSDWQDMGAAAWTAAQNEGTPTTLGTACARAAGHVVCIEPGQYSGPRSGVSWVGVFHVVNSGTQANPTVFFARYPAATNRAFPLLFTELYSPNANISGVRIGPVLACAPNVHDVIFDGFYCNEAVCASGPSEGVFQVGFGGQVRVHHRRHYFWRGNIHTLAHGYNGTYNGNSLYFEITQGCSYSDCYFEGNDDGDTHSNSGAVESYNSRDLIGEHNTFERCGRAYFDKTEDVAEAVDGWLAQNNHFRRNRVHCFAGVQSQTSRGTFVYDNLFIITGGAGAGGSAVRWGNRVDNGILLPFLQSLNVYRNTIIAPGDVGGLIIWQGRHFINTATECHSNLLVQTTAGSLFLVLAPEEGAFPPEADTLSAMARFDFNFYASPGPRWAVGATVANTIGNWRTACAAYGNDDYGRPFEADSQFGTVTFVDEIDYRLASNGQAALTAGLDGIPAGYNPSVTPGVRSNPVY